MDEMAAFDAMPQEWRALVHQHGYELVREYYDCEIPLDEARERIEEWQ